MSTHYKLEHYRGQIKQDRIDGVHDSNNFPPMGKEGGWRLTDFYNNQFSLTKVCLPEVVVLWFQQCRDDSYKCLHLPLLYFPAETPH